MICAQNVYFAAHKMQIYGHKRLNLREQLFFIFNVMSRAWYLPMCVCAIITAQYI